MLDALEARGVKALNPAPVLRWNTTKTYLADLEAAGVPVVPTVFADRVDDAVVAAARAELGGGTLVVKPQVSGGSHETVKLEPGETLVGGPSGAAMIQPFLPSVSGEGEISLLHFDGVFSHAVGKVAKAGDFRVQPQFGSTIGPITPPPGALDVAQAVLAAAPGRLTYCRVDLIRHPDGTLRVMELEAIEPDLFLEHAPEAGAVFAAAVKRAVS
jgi:glutathione synthase/RimK-type ligase-like ATP-grasp enzyme